MFEHPSNWSAPTETGATRAPHEAPVPPCAPTMALVFGIVAVALAFVPILGMFAIPPGILAALFGLAGLVEPGADDPLHRAAAISALLLAVVSVVLAVGGIHLAMADPLPRSSSGIGLDR